MRLRSPFIAAALAIAAGAAALTRPVLAGETELSGFISGELRIFPRSPAHEGQSGAALNPSLVLQPELRYQWNGGKDRLTAIPFARLDAQDRERTHFDLREFNWLHVGEGWDLRLGVDKVFWGVIESVHLVDIVNQTDLVENIDGEDKLGQPMINFGLQTDWGNLNFFVLPGFRERTFPGTRGRLRGAAPVDTDRAVFDGSAGQSHVDFVLRYTTVIGDWDIGIAQFHGVGREPRLIRGTDSHGSEVFIPHYDLIDQTSLDVQATLGDWLWKLEAIARSGQGATFAAVAAGFEYTLYGIFGTQADLGLVAEYLYDGRDEGAPAIASDDDIFLGLRLTFNDADDTDLLAGVVVDRVSGASSISVEADTRLSDYWTVEVEFRAFAGLTAEDPNFGLRRDHYLQVRLARFF